MPDPRGNHSDQIENFDTDDIGRKSLISANSHTSMMSGSFTDQAIKPKTLPKGPQGPPAKIPIAGDHWFNKKEGPIPEKEQIEAEASKDVVQQAKKPVYFNTDASS